MIDPVGKHTADMTQEEKRFLLAQLLKKKAGLSKSTIPFLTTSGRCGFCTNSRLNSSRRIRRFPRDLAPE